MKIMKHKPKTKELFNFNNPKEAIDFIRESIKDDVAFVGFSGGKDSIVTAQLVKMSGIKYRLFYSFTGIDAPEVVRFIKKYYPECIFLMPNRTFWRELSTNCPPGHIRWCCTSLKKEAAWRLPHTKRIMGIRAEESSKRSNYGRINHFEKLGHTHYYPIFNWKEWQIWDYINENNLKYPKLYDWGFDRIGCVICPFHSEKTGNMHQKYRDHWPKFFDRWEKGIIDLYYKRQKQGKQMYYKTPQEFIKAWYFNSRAKWYVKKKKEENKSNEFFNL